MEFIVPEEIFKKKDQSWPVTFSHIHGTPPHSISLYLDANKSIRGYESGDSVQLSEEIIENIFNTRKISKESDTREVLKTIINVMYTIIETSLPDADKIKFEIGEKLGKQFAKLFKSKDIDGLVEEMAEFWKEHGLGEIRDLHKENDLYYKLKVYDCYECKDMPLMPKPMCKLDEGLLTRVFEQVLNNDFFVEEIECMAMGTPYCEFRILELKE